MSTLLVIASAIKDLFTYATPVFIAIGSISCLLNIIILLKDSFRTYPVSICLVIVNICRLVRLYIVILPLVLEFGYGMASASHVWICRLFFYVAFFVLYSKPCYMAVAVIDRIFRTSSNPTTRQRSSRRFIVFTILGITIFWLLFQIEKLFFVQLIEIQPFYSICYYQSGIYLTFATFFPLIYMNMFMLVVLAVLVIWLRCNTRTVHQTEEVKPEDYELARIVTVDLVLYILVMIPSTIFETYIVITASQIKTFEQVFVENFVRLVIYFYSTFEDCLTFYINLIVSKTFRLTLMKLLRFQ